MLYGGVKYKKVRHAIQCRRCQQTIESKEQHDFKMCSCGAVGIDYERILGTEYEDRSVYCAEVSGKKLWLPAHAYSCVVGHIKNPLSGGS
jgi:hypothetical protein